MKYLYNHNSEETAYSVDDYPWGFRLRTSARFWIETNKRGSRYVQQTMNPKTGCWCKPKKSTYNVASVIAIDEKGHVHHEALVGHNRVKDIDEFIDKHFKHVSKDIKVSLATSRIIANRLDKLTFTSTVITSTLMGE